MNAITFKLSHHSFSYPIKPQEDIHEHVNTALEPNLDV